MNDIQMAGQALTKLRLENERLQAETRRLRRVTRPGRHVGIVNRAYDDARLILHLRMAGVDVSRRLLADTGQVTAWRYGWALAMLRIGRIEGVTPSDLAHLDLCIKRLQSQRDRLLDAAERDAMTELRSRAGKKYIWNAIGTRK